LILKLKHWQAFISVAKKTKTIIPVVQNTTLRFIGSLGIGGQIPFASFRHHYVSLLLHMKLQLIPVVGSHTFPPRNYVQAAALKIAILEKPFIILPSFIYLLKMDEIFTLTPK
jgi:hypothetical protein